MVFENFSEHYILSDYSSSVSELTITGDEILATVPLGAYTTLKYTSVDSLPYMLGIKEKLNISSLAEIVPADFAQNMVRRLLLNFVNLLTMELRQAVRLQ